ncbi:MAG: MFS transporter [Dinoroseobacter sp.]|nr:MFS transporter [Dinoroseobacter sp.]
MRAPPQPCPDSRQIHDARLCEAEARKFVLAAAILASAMGFIDGSVVSVAMPAIRANLGATLSQAQWVSNAYMLTLSALLLVGGALADRFGVSRVFSLAIVAFTLTSLACSVAPTVNTLIAARALQGMAAAVMVPGSLAIIAQAYPKAERGQAIGTWAAASALTTAIGPVIGGGLLDLAGDSAWRIIFALNLPLGAAAVWMLLRKTNRLPGTPGTPLDLPGGILATLGLGLLAYGLTGAKHEGAFDSRLVIWGGSGLAVLGLFLFVEAKSTHPMMPLALFRSRAFSSANLVTFALYFALSAVLFYLPMTVIAGWGLGAFEASLAFVPMTMLIALLSPMSGKWAEQIGAAPFIGGGAALVALAFAGLGATAHLHLFWTLTVPFCALMGLGMALAVAPLSSVVMGSVPDNATGSASAINNAVSRVAGLVAVAAMGSLASAVYSARGGPVSFGAVSDAPGHLGALDAGFTAVATGSAALAGASALVAALGLRSR